MSDSDTGSDDYSYNSIVGYSHGQRKLFSKEEDQKIVEMYFSTDSPRWDVISRYLPGRSPRQCRDRFNNYLNPDLTNHGWNMDEDQKLSSLVRTIGFKWVQISQFFNGRSPNNVKNRWYKHLCPAISARKLKKSSRVKNSEMKKTDTTQNIVDAVFGKIDDSDLEGFTYSELFII